MSSEKVTQASTVQAQTFGAPPRTSTSGAFPREYIAQGENVVFETRPSIVPYIGVGKIIVLLIGIIIISSALAAVSGSRLSASGSQNVLTILLVFPGLPFIFLPLVRIVLSLLSWRHTAFAITDRRAMESFGVFSRNTADCAHDKIQSVTLRQGFIARLFGYGNIIFLTAGVRSGRISRKNVISSGGVFWMGTKDPVNTRRFVEEVIDYSRKQAKIREFQDMAAVLQKSGTSIQPGASPMPVPSASIATGQRAGFCKNCGSPLDVDSKFCKACGKPVALVQA